MANRRKTFGNVRMTEGGAVTAWAARDVPVDLLQALRRYPIPATVSGANQVTFTLAGNTRPIPIWTGRDFINIDEAVTYTWTSGSNNILSSTGAAATQTASVLGVWYMYVAIQHDAALGSEALLLRPSQTAPEATPGPGITTYLGHPGTSRAYEWNYVGFMVCTTAATPVFKLMVKSGYWWKHAPTSFVVVTDSWQTPTGVVATAHVPLLAKYGLEIGGTLETGADGQIFIGSYTASTIWDAELDISEATASNVAQQIAQAPVTFAPNDTNVFYAIAAPAGDFHLTRIKDIV